MTETYFRVNFSSAVSTRKEYDQSGRRKAKLDIELPGPLLDPTNTPSEVSILLTKASIPMKMLPKLQLKIQRIYSYSNTYSLHTYNSFLYGPCFLSKILLSKNGRALYTSDSNLNAESFKKRFLNLPVSMDGNTQENVYREYSPYNYYDLATFENDVNQLLFQSSSTSNIIYPQIRFHFEDTSIRIYFSMEAVAEGQTLMKPLYGKEDAGKSLNYFSLFMSQENADIFHNLPLVDVSKFYKNVIADASWLDYFARWGQYALDLEGRVPDGILQEDGVMWMYFDFHYFNPISLVPFTSIVIYSQDFPITTQVHGIVSKINNVWYAYNNNISDISKLNVTASAQISTLPVLDVFYPLLTSENDLQDVLIISKDIVSTAGPIKLNTKSLAQYRNFTFNVGYINKDGTLHDLLLSENSNLSIQLTFIIKY